VNKNFNEEAKIVTGSSSVSKKIHVKFREFIAAFPIRTSYIQVNKNSPATGWVSRYPEG
jgi:hypothetical protein